MEKNITVGNYIKEYLGEDEVLNTLITNYHIRNVEIELLFRYFENLKRTPIDVVRFIKNSENGFELSMVGHRYNHLTNISAYNGMGYFQGAKCTIGSKYVKK